MANNDKYIKALVERDTEKALVKSDIIIRADGKPHGVCPECGLPILFSTFIFCPQCGQRINQNEWAL